MPRPDRPASPTPRGAIGVGCSGWIYRHWRGAFYPEGMAVKRWFDHYASLMSCVEINATFYRLPPATTFLKWRAMAPPGFRYVLKGSRYVTHLKRLKDPQQGAALFLERAALLGPTLGGILWQLPPNFHRDDQRLEAFLAAVPNDATQAFELRHPSWFDEAVYELLDRHRCGFVTHDLKGQGTPRRATGGFPYLRLHGWPHGSYGGSYPDHELAAWGGWLADQVRHGDQAYAFFNNDIGGAAPRDAQALAALLAARDIPVPDST